MATVTISITDSLIDEVVDLSVAFDPPLTDKFTHAQETAIHLLDVAMNRGDVQNVQAS